MFKHWHSTGQKVVQVLVAIAPTNREILLYYNKHRDNVLLIPPNGAYVSVQNQERWVQTGLIWVPIVTPFKRRIAPSHLLQRVLVSFATHKKGAYHAHILRQSRWLPTLTRNILPVPLMLTPNLLLLTTTDMGLMQWTTEDSCAKSTFSKTNYVIQRVLSFLSLISVSCQS
jgi:hypothetical protein